MKKVLIGAAMAVALTLGAAAPSTSVECDASCQENPPAKRKYDRCMRQWAANPMGVTWGEADVECREQTGWQG
jgi:uncharacterized low-complexity protein